MEQPKTYTELTDLLTLHLENVHSGKVRDTYLIPPDSSGRKLRLVVTSNRVSIFDFELGFEVPRKGEILNAFNIAARKILKATIPELKQDLVAFGARIDEHLPVELRGCSMLQRCGTVVEEVPMLLVENVVRHCLTGTGYAAYQKTGMLCGHRLPPELPEGAVIPHGPIYTPTTKAPRGEHDLDLVHTDVDNTYKGIEALSLKIFGILRGFAHSKGIMLVDMKDECGQGWKGLVPRHPCYILADEVMTPDCARFWDVAEYEVAMAQGRLPPSMDKQILRNWGAGVGIKKYDPKDPSDCAQVRNMFPPPQVIEKMSQQVLALFERLHGMSFDDYQRTVMGIEA